MTHTILLAEKLDTSAAEALRSELLTAQGNDLILNAVSVDQLGAACAELLLIAKTVWAKDGKSLSLSDASSALNRDLMTMGLSQNELEAGVDA